MKTQEQIRKAGTVGMAAALALFILSSPAQAGGNRAAVQVSATVLPSIHQTLVAQQHRLEITPEDVRKGYVDVPAATVLSVETTNLDGYFLTFVLDQSVASEAWVTNEGRTTIVSGGIGMRHEDFPGIRGEMKELSIRLILTPGVQAGTYLWPLDITATLS